MSGTCASTSVMASSQTRSCEPGEDDELELALASCERSGWIASDPGSSAHNPLDDVLSLSDCEAAEFLLCKLAALGGGRPIVGVGGGEDATMPCTNMRRGTIASAVATLPSAPEVPGDMAEGLAACEGARSPAADAGLFGAAVELSREEVARVDGTLDDGVGDLLELRRGRGAYIRAKGSVPKLVLRASGASSCILSVSISVMLADAGRRADVEADRASGEIPRRCPPVGKALESAGMELGDVIAGFAFDERDLVRSV